MREAENTTLVKQTYAAFGRGDIPGVLDTLAPDVVWAPIIGGSRAVPTAGERRGRAAVAEFFTILGRSLTFEVFEPREFVAQDDKVVALGYYRAKTAAGRPFASECPITRGARSPVGPDHPWGPITRGARSPVGPDHPWGPTFRSGPLPTPIARPEVGFASAR